MNSNWHVQYYQYVMATDPFCYYMLDEKSGTVAYDLVSGRVGGALNGAHSGGVALGYPGIGDGRHAPLYANAYTNPYSAAFNAAFDGQEGSVGLWFKMSAAGVWTDGSRHDAVFFWVNASNFMYIIKVAANNRLEFAYVAGGAVKSRQVAGLASADWYFALQTWSKTADQYACYLDGALQGAVQAGLGAWVGNLSATQTLFGALDTTPTNPWSGYFAHAAVWDRALSADEVLTLYEAGISL